MSCECGSGLFHSRPLTAVAIDPTRKAALEKLQVMEAREEATASTDDTGAETVAVTGRIVSPSGLVDAALKLEVQQ